MSYVIHPLITAQLAVDVGRLTYLRNYGTTLWVPSPFYVITGGPEPVLVDTSGPARLLSDLRAEPVKAVMEFDEALAQIGLSPEGITMVIHTHLMYDHCANSSLLPRAKFVVQKKELEFARDPHPMFAGMYQSHLFEDLPFTIVDGDYELLPGIRLLFTPGHSPGCQSAAVSTSAGTAIITGFCCLQENFQPEMGPKSAYVTDIMPEVVPPGIHTDMLKAYESMVRIKTMADILIPFHDPIMAAKKVIPEDT
jgi:N-acyl homoserine lactone hydrolase